MPSWTALQTERASRNLGHTDGETYEDSPEEIKQRSVKETEILTGNLGDAIIPAHEILADPAQLRILALLQESMVSDTYLFFYHLIHSIVTEFVFFTVIIPLPMLFTMTWLNYNIIIQYSVVDR